MGITIFGVEIRFYGILMAVGFLLAAFICAKLFEKRGFKKEIVLDLLLLIFPLSIIGARLYYVIFSGRSWTFLEILSVWDGGLAIYGGIIGGLIGVIIYALIKKINILDLTDAIAVGLIIAQSIGRIGCYFSSCCYGVEVTNSALQWFPLSVKIDGVWHLATFFYESFWNLLGFILLLIVYNKVKQKGLNTGIYLMFYGFGRFFIEGLRTDSLYILSFRVSQLVSLAIVITGIFFLFVFFAKKKSSEEKNQQIGL